MSKEDIGFRCSAIIVSPSGNFYGSEQVLFDHMRYSDFTYEIYVPQASVFAQKLKSTRHRIREFTSPVTLYARIFLRLLSGKYRTVYINEAGHSRYINLLARIFPGFRFLVHVRIMEDTLPEKWQQLRQQNTTLITISAFLQQSLKPTSIMVRDLYDFPESVKRHLPSENPEKNVAIVGRVSYSKGFLSLVALVEMIAGIKRNNAFFLNIYGDISNDVKNDPGLAVLQAHSFVRFHGFVNSQEIYRNNELVLHLSKREPLGRIFFEAISAGRPMVGFNAGGIGEIAGLCGLDEFMVEESSDEIKNLLEKITEVLSMHGLSEILDKALIKMKKEFGVERYVSKMDSLITQTHE